MGSGRPQIIPYRARRQLFRDISNTGDSIVKVKARNNTEASRTTVWRAVKREGHLTYTKSNCSAHCTNVALKSSKWEGKRSITEVFQHLTFLFMINYLIVYFICLKFFCVFIFFIVFPINKFDFYVILTVLCILGVVFSSNIEVFKIKRLYLYYNTSFCLIS